MLKVSGADRGISVSAMDGMPLKLPSFFDGSIAGVFGIAGKVSVLIISSSIFSISGCASRHCKYFATILSRWP
jgi:hypothetical protein